jgi:histone H3
MARTKQTAPKRNKSSTEKVKVKANADHAGKPERKKYRFKPGTQALREIRRYQKSVDTLVPKMPLRRLIREVAAPYKEDLRFSRTSMEALQEASEAYLVELFTDANNCAIQHGRVTIEPHDMRLALAMRHDHTLPQVALLEPTHAPRNVVPSKKRSRKSQQKKTGDDETSGPVSSDVAMPPM